MASIDVSPISFRDPIILDPERRGSEPALTFDSDGTIFVCTIRGALSGSHLWRSLDEGKTFEYIGTQLPSYAPVVRSGAGDLGGGDCDMGTDAGGRVYLVDLWAGSSSVASTLDRGETWRGVPVSQASPGMDRPWILGGEPDEVFVTGQDYLAILGGETRGRDTPPVGGIWVARSTDGGLTFPQQVLAVSNEKRLGANGNLAFGAGNLYLPYTQKIAEGRLAIKIAVSHDRGLTWDHVTVAEQSFYAEQCGFQLARFPIVAADSAEGVYLTWALQGPAANRRDVFFASSPDAGAHWNVPVSLTNRPGTRVLPWITTGEPGTVGLAWFETNVTMIEDYTPDVLGSLKLVCDWTPPSPDAEWFLHYAFTDQATHESATFQETLVQQTPIHKGHLSRPYFEVLQTKFDPRGRAAVTYIADAPDGVARPTFALQASGPLGKE